MSTVSRRRFAALALAVTGGLALGAVPRTGAAEPAKPKVEVMVLYARQDPKGGQIDPQVAKISQLTQPPFSAYNSYTLVDKKLLPLDAAKGNDPWKGKPSAPYALPNGKTIQVALLDVMPDKRFRMGAELGDSKIEYRAGAGEPFFLAGQSYKDGILVIGLTVKP